MTRAQLQLAGLGVFLYGSSDEIYDELIDNYPKLAGGGEYDLLRQDATRQLDVIPIPPGGYSVEYIRISSTVLKCILGHCRSP